MLWPFLQSFSFTPLIGFFEYVFANLAFGLPWKPIKFSILDKIHYTGKSSSWVKMLFKTQTCSIRMKAFLLISISAAPQKNMLIKLKNRRAPMTNMHTLTARAKENHQLNYEGPGHRQASGKNHLRKVLGQGRYWWVWDPTSRRTITKDSIAINLDWLDN